MYLIHVEQKYYYSYVSTKTNHKTPFIDAKISLLLPKSSILQALQEEFPDDTSEEHMEISGHQSAKIWLISTSYTYNICILFPRMAKCLMGRV